MVGARIGARAAGVATGGGPAHQPLQADAVSVTDAGAGSHSTPSPAHLFHQRDQLCTSRTSRGVEVEERRGSSWWSFRDPSRRVIELPARQSPGLYRLRIGAPIERARRATPRASSGQGLAAGKIREVQISPFGLILSRSEIAAEPKDEPGLRDDRSASISGQVVPQAGAPRTVRVARRRTDPGQGRAVRGAAPGGGLDRARFDAAAVQRTERPSAPIPTASSRSRTHGWQHLLGGGDLSRLPGAHPITVGRE